MACNQFKVGDRVYIIGSDPYWWMITEIIGEDIAVLERRNERTDKHETTVTNFSYGMLAKAHMG